MKIIKHTFCTHGDKCSIIGQEADIVETVKAVIDNQGNVIEPEYYWARVTPNRKLHKLGEQDLAK